MTQYQHQYTQDNPINDDERIKVFVGCDPNNCDLEQMMVLDYSINKHSSMPVDIVWMQLSANPDSFWYANAHLNNVDNGSTNSSNTDNADTGNEAEGWNTSKWATPFSGFRWAIAEYCNFEGRAIYMDADVVILSDLAELWTHPIEGEAVVAAKTDYDITRLCTCVWDCAKAQSVLMPIAELKSDAKGHHKMMKQFGQRKELITPYQDSFNCIDGEDLAIEDINLLHYSDMGTQFSHTYALPRLAKEGRTHWFDGEIMTHPRADLIELFDTYYNEALQAGYSLEDYRVTPIGDFKKQSQKNYQGNKVTRPVS